MIKTRVDQILKLVRDGSILSKTAFASADLSAALSLREVDSYRNYYISELHARWRILPIHPDFRLMYEELRQTTHDIVEMRIRDTDTGLTGRDADDLANILADRIEQEITDIAKSRATEYRQDWYEQLWDSYVRDEIPMIEAGPLIKPLIAAKKAG